MSVLVPSPAAAIAVAHCVNSRMFPSDPLTHPVEGCRFCGMSTSDLLEALKYFEIVAESHETEWRAEHIAAFRALPEAEQKRLVREAQAIPVAA